jgi:HPt (histidine-containing phosphotransfer) domain-containing protein
LALLIIAAEERKQTMNQPPVNLSTLNELRSIMGSDFGHLIEVFIADSAARISAMHAAVAVRDGESLRKAAHSIKGSCMNIAAAELAELCRQLELLGRDGGVDSAGPVLANAEAEFLRVKDYLASVPR